ncbi:MAG TPA: tRNA-dihydrouridine synthase [Terriglobales bacterium]|nr:tRNA-dihydrouridine synthase [Terriglobales bacterium]
MPKNMPTLTLAPLAGFTDKSFRALCLELGAGGATTEMVSAKALVFGDKKSLKLAEPGDARCAVQLFGSEPAVMAEAAAIVAALFPAAIDINMGCPVPKVVSNGEGSALMRNPALICRLVEAAGKSGLPVTVKMRAGIDGVKNAPECARAAESGGAVSVTVHGRLREQMYHPGTVDISVIAAVKEAVSIPVIANGDIMTPADMADMLRETGADGVMIGRAALGNPAVFRELAGGAKAEVPERMALCRRQIAAMVADKGEKLAMREARAHLCWYLRGMRDAAALRAKAVRLETLAQFEALMKEVEPA